MNDVKKENFNDDREGALSQPGNGVNDGDEIKKYLAIWIQASIWQFVWIQVMA